MKRAKEVPLAGGNLTRVVRVGGTVRRSAGPWTPLVHGLLEHVRARGFSLAPGPLGVDERGREVLEFIPGDTVVGEPWPSWVWSEALLLDAVHALRAYHAAVVDFRPAVVLSRLGRFELETDQLVCHNDFAPYNCVVRHGRLVGVIDWDVIVAGRAEWDLAFFIWHWVPLHGPSPDLEWRTLDVCKRRLRLVLDNYGRLDCDDIIEVVLRRIESSRDGIRDRAAAGDRAFQHLYERGHVEEMQRALDYVSSIRGALASIARETWA